MGGTRTFVGVAAGPAVGGGVGCNNGATPTVGCKACGAVCSGPADVAATCGGSVGATGRIVGGTGVAVGGGVGDGSGVRDGDGVWLAVGLGVSVAGKPWV